MQTSVGTFLIALLTAVGFGVGGYYAGLNASINAGANPRPGTPPSLAYRGGTIGAGQESPITISDGTRSFRWPLGNFIPQGVEDVNGHSYYKYAVDDHNSTISGIECMDYADCNVQLAQGVTAPVYLPNTNWKITINTDDGDLIMPGYSAQHPNQFFVYTRDIAESAPTAPEKSALHLIKRKKTTQNLKNAKVYIGGALKETLQCTAADCEMKIVYWSASLH